MRIHADPDLKPNGNTQENTNTKTRLINLPNGSSSAETSRFEGQRYRQSLTKIRHMDSLQEMKYPVVDLVIFVKLLTTK